jgi:hypothetical protein
MAYEFTAASSQYLSVATAPATVAPLTMACWFRAATITGAHALICLNSTTATDRHVLLLRGDLAGDPVSFFSAAGASNAAANSTTSFSANTWYHACGVLSSSASRSVYLNAGGVATQTTNLATGGLSQTSIGAQRFLTFPLGASFMGGQIAEVGIWNAALTAAEIASLAKGMACDKVRPQNLVFYAPLIRDLIDAKGGLAITNNNGATVANHTRVYA